MENSQTRIILRKKQKITTMYFTFESWGSATPWTPHPPRFLRHLGCGPLHAWQVRVLFGMWESMNLLCSVTCMSAYTLITPIPYPDKEHLGHMSHLMFLDWVQSCTKHEPCAHLQIPTRGWPSESQLLQIAQLYHQMETAVTSSICLHTMCRCCKKSHITHFTAGFDCKEIHILHR